MPPSVNGLCSLAINAVSLSSPQDDIVHFHDQNRDCVVSLSKLNQKDALILLDQQYAGKISLTPAQYDIVISKSGHDIVVCYNDYSNRPCAVNPSRMTKEDALTLIDQQCRGEIELTRDLCNIVLVKSGIDRNATENQRIVQGQLDPRQFHPKLKNQAFINTLTAFYQKKGLPLGDDQWKMMNRGAAILDKINEGYPPVLPTDPEERAQKAEQYLRDLMWYVEADSCLQEGCSINAMHTCSDEKHKFYDFIKTCAVATGKSYSRGSTHYAESRISHTQLGVDIDGLPGGKSTLLFGMRLDCVTYFKMELYGCGPIFSSCFLKNLINCTMHVIELIRVLGQYLGLVAPTDGGRKEKIDHGVRTEFKDYVKTMSERKVEWLRNNSAETIQKRAQEICDQHGPLYIEAARSVAADKRDIKYIHTDEGQKEIKELVERNLEKDGSYIKGLEAAIRKEASSDLKALDKGMDAVAAVVNKYRSDINLAPYDPPILKAAMDRYEMRKRLDAQRGAGDVARYGDEFIHAFITEDLAPVPLPPTPMSPDTIWP